MQADLASLTFLKGAVSSVAIRMIAATLAAGDVSVRPPGAHYFHF
jgi:hypothetical protein